MRLVGAAVNSQSRGLETPSALIKGRFCARESAVVAP
jgi:hypothetical protein